MKNIILYAVYDRVAGTYSVPFAASNLATAEREFLETCSKSPYRLDFEMYVVGEYTVESGCLTAYDKPEFIRRFDEVSSNA
jgi:hypothetical protein